MFFFFKQKTAYEMRISDWSSDVCSSDLGGVSWHRSWWMGHALRDAGGPMLRPAHDHIRAAKTPVAAGPVTPLPSSSRHHGYPATHGETHAIPPRPDRKSVV